MPNTDNITAKANTQHAANAVAVRVLSAVLVSILGVLLISRSASGF